jgi:hypothetical protein
MGDPLFYIRSHQVSAEALDYACAQGLLFNKTRLAYLKDCAVHFEQNGLKPKLVAPERPPESVHLRQMTFASQEVCDA